MSGDMLELYVDLHRHPELSGAEERTAARVGGALDRAGFAVTSRVGGHGVVGRLRNGDGPVVLLRAELDALPVRERTGLPYASTGPAMHACGHDLHLAALCGAAEALSRSRDRWRGTVVAVGQPAEETLTGAAAMLADGLYTRWGRPDAALAQHLGPFPAGWVAHARDTVTAGSAWLAVTVFGRGGHAGLPGAVSNPIPVAAAIVTRLGELFPAEPSTSDGVVLTIGAVRAGDRANVVADRATIRLTVRSLDSAALDRAVATVDAAVREICAAAGSPAEPEIVVTTRSAPGVNEPLAAERVRAAHVATFGAARVLPVPPSMATEDFPLFGADATVPTVYWAVGSVSAAAWTRAPGADFVEKLRSVPVNHSPEFAPDPVPTLRTATTAMLAGARALLDSLEETETPT
ncbi:amidohydrolase [Virgisporangium aurantiacum]|nr:amidohydrolase [Virgisporangium aurantiacum]